MRTTEIFRSNDGEEAWFQVNGTFMTRFGVERIVRRIPGARITKSQRSWRVSRDDDFTHFTINDGQFIVFEPWGDSDLYRIHADNPAAVAEIGRVQEHFRRYKRWFGVI